MGKPIQWGATSVRLLIDLGITGIESSPPPLSPPSDMIISTLTDVEEAPVIYVGGDGDIEGVATIGVYVQPSTGKCRFRETDIPGVYAVYLRDERYAVDNGASPPILARTLLINFSGSDGLPSTGVSFEIDLVGYDPYDTPPSTAELVDAIWQEPIADHEGVAGSTAEALATAGGSGASAADIADAVWDEATSGHTTSGTFGEQLKTDVDAILADTNELETDWSDGGRLDVILDARASQTSVDDLPTNAELATSQAAADDATLAAIAALNDLSAAQVNAEVDAAIETYHLDHLLAATYDPASKPGAADALLNELVENDGGVARYTANALEQAPTGGSAPTAEQIADQVWDEAKAGHVAAGSFGELAAQVLEDTGTTLQAELDGIQADTEDIQSKIGTPAAASVSADILVIDNLVDDLESRLGTPSNLGGGATVAANLADIEGQTDDIGVAGAGLTALATQASVDTIDNLVDDLESRLTATRAGYLDNLNALKVKKNSALANFPFKMVLAADHVTPATGLTITATRSLDGAAFAACANAATEISAGWYKINLAAGDLNGDTVILKFTSATADQRDFSIATQP